MGKIFSISRFFNLLRMDPKFTSTRVKSLIIGGYKKYNVFKLVKKRTPKKNV